MRYMILDFNNVLHLSHVPWTQENPGPENNGLVSNFLTVLGNHVARHSADVLIIATEGTPKLRHELLKNEYKAHRPKRDEPKWVHFKRQMRLIQSSMTKLFPCVIMRHENLEADDTIYEVAAYLCEEVIGEDDDVIIMSSDKDLMQCLYLDDRVKLWSPQQKKFREKPEPGFLERKALQGDASDNIKGVAGIGPKRSEKIVREGILSWLEEFPEHKDVIERNLKLMKLYRWNEIEGERTAKPSLWNFSQARFEIMLKDLGLRARLDTMGKQFSKLQLPEKAKGMLTVKAIL